MASNSRLAMAIHTAGMLAFADKMPVTSEKIAESVGTNAVVIRRLIGQLTKHNLVQVQMGTGGGSRLTRLPHEITLAEIYLALEEDEIFQVPILDEEHSCLVSRVARPVIADCLQDAEKSLLQKLNSINLADVIEKVKTKIQTECPEELNG
jgi:Rrf2 family protein